MQTKQMALLAMELAAWVSFLRAAGRPETTIRLRVYHVARIGRELGVGDPWTVTGEELVEWFARYPHWSKDTRRSYRSSARAFGEWAVATGRIERNPALLLPAVRSSEPRPRPTPERAYRAALERATPREALMLRLAAELGMRRGEVCQVHRRDLVDDLLGWSLVVHGKGGKERVLPVPDELARRVRVAVLAGEGGYAFPGRVDGHLSAHYVGKLVSRLLPDGVAMHTLRHRFATRAYQQDRDLLTVQTLLGHASPDTTQRYVAAPSDALRRTVLAVAG